MRRRDWPERPGERMRHLRASAAAAGAWGEHWRARLAFLGASPFLPLRLMRDALLAERERWPLWLPVLVGTGIGVYYALPFEPPPVWMIPLALALVACRMIAVGSVPRHSQGGSQAVAAVSWSFAMLAPVALGFATAQWQSARLATVTLPHPVRAAAVIGTVERMEDGEGSLRLVMRRSAAAPPLAGVRLRRLRVIVRTEHPAILPGDRVRVFARLEPPADPALPGGFDPARREWLRGIGALGYALAPPRLLAPGAGREPGLATSIAGWRRSVAKWRRAVAHRIRRVLPGADGGLAIALLTGQRGWLPRETTRQMRDAGLAHLLAISGLHLGLVAGFVFAVVRLVLALVPAIALRRDAKKPAALVALAAATGYLLLSGGSVATERAFLMTGLALLAVVLGRDPFSMRLVAFAALVMLLVRPSDLLEPGFQMSFAAVVALIGVYETWSLRTRTPRTRHAVSRRERVGRYILGVLATTLIAEAAIAPFSVYQFHGLARYGLLANLVAVPATAFWVMPSGVLSLISMPFGLEEWPLRMMAGGVSLIREVAREVAGLQGARWVMPGYPVAALVLIALGGCWAMIWQSLRLKVLALLPLAAACAMILSTPLPDVLVDGRGRLLAVRHGGTLFVSDLRRARGSRLRWQRALGLARVARWDRPPLIDGVARSLPMVCGRPGCLAEVASRMGPRRFLLQPGQGMAGAGGRCPRIDVVISLLAKAEGGECRPARARIDADRLAVQGAHAFFVDHASGAIRIETVAEARGRRPWTRRSFGRP